MNLNPAEPNCDPGLGKSAFCKSASCLDLVLPLEPWLWELHVVEVLVLMLLTLLMVDMLEVLEVV